MAEAQQRAPMLNRTWNGSSAYDASDRFLEPVPKGRAREKRELRAAIEDALIERANHNKSW